MARCGAPKLRWYRCKLSAGQLPTTDHSRYGESVCVRYDFGFENARNATVRVIFSCRMSTTNLHVRFLVQILGQFSSYIFGFTTFKNIISSNLLLTRFRLIVWCVFKSIFWIYFFAWICLQWCWIILRINVGCLNLMFFLTRAVYPFCYAWVVSQNQLHHGHIFNKDFVRDLRRSLRIYQEELLRKTTRFTNHVNSIVSWKCYCADVMACVKLRNFLSNSLIIPFDTHSCLIWHCVILFCFSLRSSLCHGNSSQDEKPNCRWYPVSSCLDGSTGKGM